MVAIEVYVGCNGEPKPVSTVEELTALHYLLGMILRSTTNTPPAPVAPPVVASEPSAVSEPTTTLEPVTAANVESPLPLETPKRAVDYARSAAQSFGRPFTTKELMERMTADGWTSNRTTPESILNLVRRAMKEAGGFVYQQNGKWEYRPGKTKARQ